MHWIFLFVAILCEALATSALKLTEGFTRPGPTIGIFIGYGLSFYLFSLAVKTISVSVAYALWSGIGLVVVVLAGWLYFGQKLDAPALLGLGFILVGIVIVHTFSKSVVY